jgi:hypothetical protein
VRAARQLGRGQAVQVVDEVREQHTDAVQREHHDHHRCETGDRTPADAPPHLLDSVAMRLAVDGHARPWPAPAPGGEEPPAGAPT